MKRIVQLLLVHFVDFFQFRIAIPLGKPIEADAMVLGGEGRSLRPLIPAVQ
jgi:hypothetical protein